MRKISLTCLFLLLITGITMGQNPISIENALTGTPQSTWDSPDGANIQGFATNISVNKGSTVDFKININSASLVPFTVNIYRIGYYQGNGARFIANLGPSLTGKSQPAYLYESATGKVDCSNWTVSASWAVPSTAVSGVYVAKIAALGQSSHIIFIVRDDAGNSPVLFKTSDATWQSYNSYGGNTFYAAATPVPGFTHAVKLSYQRPLVMRGDKSNFFNAEFPMIMWLERNGYHVSYATDMDMARDQSVYTPSIHKVLLSVGHDEYWSAEQFNKFETARNNGVNIAFFSGNSLYWKTRWENNFQTLVCYKEGSLGIYGCGTKCDPMPNVWTGLWRDGCLPVYGANDGCRPEGSFLGQMGWVETTGSIKVPDTYKNLRLWKNTTIATLGVGQTAVLPLGTLGAEWDQEQFVETFPAHRIPLSFTTYDGLNHSMALYRHDNSGALVFSAGSMQWSWGLEAKHDNVSLPASLDMQQATANLLKDMGVTAATLQAGIVPPSVSIDVQPPVTTIVSPIHNSSVPGSPITISGTAVDMGGGAVGGVEVSTNNGITWHHASGFENWSYTFSPTGYGNIDIKVRAWDDVFNLEIPGPAGSSNAISITLTGPFSYTVFNANYPAGTPDFFHIAEDIELGMKFKSTIPGIITGFRFYKGAGVTGQHTGHLWTSTGTLLAAEPFVNETASGWQTVQLTNPVAIAANTTYIVSYFSAAGKYSYTNAFFTQALVNGPLRGLANGEDGGNGVVNYTGSGFPTASSGSTNYYADVIFTSSDVTPPQVSTVTPLNNATAVLVSANPTATFNEAVDPGTITTLTMILKGPGNTIIPGTVSTNSAVITFDPTSALAPNIVYTMTLRGGNVEPVVKDLSGNALANDYIWSFTTENGQPPIVSINPDGQTTCPNSSISFTSAANGIPAPTVQWEVSTDNGNNWNVISGAINATYNFVTVIGDNGKQYRAVWTNAFGFANSNPAILVVNPNGNAGIVTGSSPLCIGATATYSTNGDAGGVWSSSNNAIATINSSGLVTAIGQGTATITYTVCNGIANASVTVSPNANAGTISGSSPLCIGLNNTYTSNGDAGGTWTSTNTAVATVNATTGEVTTVSAGSTNITYTINAGCNNPVSSVKTLTVSPNADAGAIIGQGRLCVGTTATYTSNGNQGGEWVSLNTAVATIDMVTGVANAISEGFADFKYTINTGCFSPVSSFLTIQVQTSIAPGTVSGTSPLCSSTTSTYTSNGVVGGVWSSSNTAVATVNANSGLVSAIAAGNTDITYTLVGCSGQTSSFKTLTVNQDASAGGISGTTPICTGNSVTYNSSGDPGGIWSSTNTSIATVIPATGVVTGVAAGTTNITYTVAACNGTASAFEVLTVNPSVNPGTITGTSPLCIGATLTFTSNGDAGGVWSSTNTAVATVNPSTGFVSAIGAGTASINYTIPGCNGTAVFAVTVSPNANAGMITGSSPLCIGVVNAYTSDGDAGGTWTSTNTAVATVNATTGEVTAVSAGSTNITYTVSSGCNNPVSSFKMLTVNPNANAGTISGQGRLCVGTTATYTSNGESGGTWFSFNTAVATINPATGVVNAISEGFADFKYTINTGCAAPAIAYTTIQVQTSINPGTISGTSPLCMATTATYSSNGVVGGVWSSTNTSVATVNASTGLVTTIAAGNTDITYTLVGCTGPTSSFKTLTVNPNSNAGVVSGTSPLCIADIVTYSSNGEPGGTWTSTNTSVATVNPATGEVTAIAAGATNITYTVNSCNGTSAAFKSLTVSPNANPGIISGSSPLCIGATATYTSNGTTGGVWSSTNTSIVTVNASTGLVTAIGTGTASVNYTVPGCNGTSALSVTVSPNANAGTVSGTSPLCIAVSSIYTSNGNAGGTWSSSNTSVATVNAVTGEVTTLAAGSTDIMYTISTGCNNPVSVIKTLTVSPNVNSGVISGQPWLCIGTSATFTSNGNAGGTWVSLNPTVASINSSTGVVNAIGPDFAFADLKYTINTGCASPVSSYLTIQIRSDISAGIVSGTSPLCIGATATYSSNGLVGGVWSSTNTTVASVNASTGLVTALASGVSNITYTLVGCGNTAVSAIKTLTVNPNANAGTVSGTSPLCLGATTTYTTDGNVTGVWTSTNTSVATVNPSTGFVTVVAAGSTNITYTVSGCNGPAVSFKTLTVNPNVNAGTVTGLSPLCIGATATYSSNGHAGGTWSSTNTAVATVNPTTGLVTALAVGTTDITYTVSGCSGPAIAFQSLTVNVCANSMVNLKLFLEGYYIGASAMQPVLLNQGVGISNTETDNITVELRNAASPHAIAATTTGMLKTDGTVSLTYPAISGSFYIVVNHRNTIQTWSTDPVTVGPVAAMYDFTTAANKAFGDNMKQMGSVWVMYTGDLNQDEFIDASDYPMFDTDNFNGVNGVYVATDMNGDGFVDASDYPVFDSNNFNGIQSIHP